MYTYIYMHYPFEFFWAFSHSKNLKFAYCLGGFLVKVTLNLLKSALSVHTTILHLSVFFLAIARELLHPYRDENVFLLSEKLS